MTDLEGSSRVLARGRVLVSAVRQGRVQAVSGAILLSRQGLSLWGGLEPSTGRIVDPRHAQHGRFVADTIWRLPRGLGSSSASSVLLEAVRQQTAPAVLLLEEADEILALGAAVARELYEHCPGVVVVPEVVVEDGQRVVVRPDGAVERAE